MNAINKLCVSLVAASLLGCGSAPRSTLEDVADNGGAEEFIATAYAEAKANVRPRDLASINTELRPYDRVYKSESEGQSPVVLFFHGCSGATVSHEEDWAAFYNSIGVGMIAVDSYTGRSIEWEDACDLRVMTTWQRAADVLATIEFAKRQDYIDANQIILMGFSHGAITVWTTQVFASTKTTPLGLDSWPEGVMDGVQLSLPFYGSCIGEWTLPLRTIAFLAEDDRYIDEQSCVDFAEQNTDVAEHFSYKVFAGATHTFDHSRPNASNVEAGSVYDAAATAEAQAMIASEIKSFKD
ncbi:MAG: dienelactone hydrolase family protein [Pseudomonadales bacterium]